MTKKRVWIVTVLFFLGFLIGFTNEYHIPRLKTWSLVQIEKAVRKNTSLRILAKDINFSLWPLGISLSQVKISPQKELAQQLAPIQIQKITLSAAPHRFFQRGFKILSLYLEKPEITLIFKEQQKEKKGLSQLQVPQKSSLLNKVFQIPLSQIFISQMTLQTWLKGKELLTRSTSTDLSLQILNQELQFSFIAPKVTFKKNGEPAKLSTTISTVFSLSEKQLRISSFNIKKGSSSIETSGVFSGSIEQQKIDRTNLQLKSQLHLNELYQWFQQTLPEIQLKPIAGIVNIDLSIKKVGPAKPRIRWQGSGQKIKYSKYQIGQFDLEGLSDSVFFHLPQIEIKNSSGLIQMKDTKFYLNQKKPIETQLVLKDIQIYKFLKNLNVDAPVEMLVSGETPCQMTYRPHLKAKCSGQIIGRSLLIHDDTPQKKVILSSSQVQLNGQLQADTEKVSYSTQIAVREPQSNKPSLGKSDGVIHYDHGFKINYQTDELNFQNVKNLADLKIQGSARIQGETSGNSKTAKAKMQIQTKDFWFEDFAVGNALSKLRFEKGALYFNNVNAQLNKSRYQGDLLVDLNKKKLSSEFVFTHVNANDIQMALSRRLPFPLDLNGIGKAKVKLWGPLIVNRLNYDGQLELFRGSLGGETFNNLSLKATSRDGYVELTQGLMAKQQTPIYITGKGWPDGRIQSEIKASNISLESIDRLNELGAGIKGRLSFKSNIFGTVSKPQATLESQIEELFIHNAPLSNSQLDLSLTEEAFSGKSQLFGDQLELAFLFPFVKSRAFSLFVDAKKWDFSKIFGFIHSSPKDLNYQTELSAQIRLNSPKGLPFQTDGFISLQHLQFIRDGKGIATTQPWKSIAKKGVFKSKPLLLKGPDSKVNLSMNHFSVNDLSSQASGQIDLSLFAVLTPFFETINGPMNFSFKTQGSIKKPEVLGSIFVEDATLKFRNFPHPLEKLRADLLFSQSKLLVNSLKTQINTGNVNASGSILFEGFKSIPLNLHVNVKDVETHFPEKVTLRTNSDLKITNSWFPFKISGSSEVISGSLTREFSQFASNNKDVQESPFLPDQLIKTESKLFDIDIDVDLKEPVKVKNSLISTAFRGKLRAQGHPLFPTVKGLLTAQGGQVFFREIPFNITQGTVNFTEQAPINPTLYFTADTRVQDFDISFLLQGTATTPEINLSSLPSLPNQDIISLLALGVISGDSLEDYDSGQQATSSALIGLTQGFSREIKDQFGVNLQVSQEVSETAPDKKEAVQKITIKKELFSKLEGAVTSSIGEESAYDVKLQYKVNDNLSVIGSWENTDSVTTEITDDSSEAGGKVGLDVELKYEFK